MDPLGSAPGCFPQDELCRVNLTPEGLRGDAPTCFSSLVAQNCPQELLGAWTWGCGGHTLLSSWNQLLQHIQGVMDSPKSP